jgi:hypothetical protein
MASEYSRRANNSTNYVHPNEEHLLNLHHGMAYDPYGAPVLRIDDTTKQHTSKNRVKVSTYEITDFGSFTYSKDEDIWDEAITGTASSTHDPYIGKVKLEVGGTAGDEIVRQTRRIQRYIPGRQNEVSMTVLFSDPTAGIRRRFGLFDSLNGAYFEDGGDDSYYVAVRRNTESGPVERRVARANWNIDPLDGTGPSGITADPQAIQHMVIEYEWYGAGMVEFKFIINNNAYPVHQFRTGNVEEYSWSSTAALPVRIELTNVTGTPGTHTFLQGSHSFATEARTELLGRQHSVASPLTGYTLSEKNTFYPLVAIRLKADRLNGVVIPDEFAGATLDNTSIFVRVIEGAIVTGGEWISFSPASPVEYNLTATGFTNGNILGTNFINSGNIGSVQSFSERSITQLARKTTTTIGDTSETFLVAVASSAANKTGWASLGWIEVR